MNEKISRIQKEVGVMQKDKAGYNYKYFDINQLLEKLLPCLENEGLTLIQPLTHVEGRPALKTLIWDSKDMLEYVVPLPDLPDPQKMGSVITYYRRYALVSLLGLQAEDDDGASVTKAPNVATPNPTTNEVAGFDL